MGVEPTNGGFADLSLRPLGYRAPDVFEAIASNRGVKLVKYSGIRAACEAWPPILYWQFPSFHAHGHS